METDGDSPHLSYEPAIGGYIFVPLNHTTLS